MKPIYLAAENLKGLTFSYDLRPVNCFTGPNDSGKTAVLDAAIIALLGYHPALGKQNQHTIMLMGENRLDMMVTMQFDDSSANTINWNRKANQEIKKTEKIDVKNIPPVMFDLRSYLTMTKKERIKMICEKISDKDLSFDEQALLDNLKTIEVVPAAKCKLALAELETFVTKSIKMRARSKTSIQEWLSTLVKELDDEKKRYTILKDQVSAQLVGLRPQSASAPLKSVETQLQELQTKKAEVTAKLTELRTRQAQISKSSVRRTELEMILNVPDNRNIAENQVFAESLKKEISDHVPHVSELSTKIQNQLDMAKRSHEEVVQLESATNELQRRIDALDGHVKCPFCKSSRQGWKDEHRKELTEQLEIATKSLKQKTIQHEKIVADGRQLRQKMEEATKTETLISAKRQKLAALQKEINDADALANRKAQAKAELDGIILGSGTVNAAELDQLTAELSTFSEKITKLESDEFAFKTSAQNQEKAKRLENELLAHQATAEVFKLASAKVIEEQEKLVTTAFRPLVEISKKFTDGILPGTIDYRNGDFGMHTNDGWIPHETMATASRTLAYIGLAVALAQQSPIKVVILDEAGIIDANRKPKVLDRLLSLCRDGVIDCAFLADPSNEGYSTALQDKDFQIINLPPINLVG